MKKILGLDLGTNSIGWSLVNFNLENKTGEIKGLGSRIIPMTQDTLGKFDSGSVSDSPTAARRGFRGTRRLRQRVLLRRERLHRVLTILGFLPKHYQDALDFETKLGQIKQGYEPKIAYELTENGRFEFRFKESFYEMTREFQAAGHANLKFPYDWTIYYLRKKALTQKIHREELAWLLLNFNQKRGYYQLRGEEEETEPKNKREEFHQLKVTDVQERERGKSGVWYHVILENGWIYKRESKFPLFGWIGTEKEFIVTTELNDDGSIKLNKEGEEKRSFRAPKEDDWKLQKIKTEKTIANSGKTVGQFIYDALLANPKQKIRGEFVRTIERSFYKNELEEILKTQIEWHDELRDPSLFNSCINELYRSNEAHRNSISKKDFFHLILQDILFFQRPLKSKKSLISDCKLEHWVFKKQGVFEKQSIKCIPKSHPLFQEFRLWQFVQNLKIYKKEAAQEIDVTNQFIPSEESLVSLFDQLNDKKVISQKQFLTLFKLKEDTHRWNFVEGKEYPCNETRYLFLSKAKQISGFPLDFFANPANTESLWHLLYSVTDSFEIKSALQKFAEKHQLPDTFVEVFRKTPPFKNEYGAFSAKAIKKLLPLLRTGKYWQLEAIDSKTRTRIDNLLNGVEDENIRLSIREKARNFTDVSQFRGLPLWFASYVVYNVHSESTDLEKWTSPSDIDHYLNNDFKQYSLRNPIVEQVVTETLRVVRDIWKEYGQGKADFFQEIHIELGREMKNPAKKREQMTLKNVENENTNIRIKAILEELKNQGVRDVRPHSPSQQEILKIYEEGVYAAENRKEELEIIDKIRKSNRPSSTEIQRYKLWLDQGYRSPYTGNNIQLSDLFTTRYQIEHIFPQSRFFDDSLTNKVICESEVNALKDNQTAREFIQNHAGQLVTLSGGQTVRIFSPTQYEEHVQRYFAKNRTKLKNLLSIEIPESFINRQLNDARYISKVIKNYLSKIVREGEGEQREVEATSKNVIVLSGAITSRMKQDWGLNAVWNDLITPRFERLNELTQSNLYGQWETKQGKRVFQTNVPENQARGFSKKRIDHRHHALDALVIACTTREHVHYLNALQDERTNYALVSKLRKMEEYTKDGQTRRAAGDFFKPWDTFTQDCKEALANVVVSFKQNTRVINKTTNLYEKFVDGKKVKVAQTKGDSRAIRKPLHADTVNGKVFLKRLKATPVPIAQALQNIDFVADAGIKAKLKARIKEGGGDLEQVKKQLKKEPLLLDNQPVLKVPVYEILEATASRKSLDISFDEKKIDKITDTGIQKILLKHLQQEIYQNAKDENGKKIPPHELAFSEEGLEALNKHIVALNDGKDHQPIKKVRIYEEGGKFALGETGNKSKKFVETADGEIEIGKKEGVEVEWIEDPAAATRLVLLPSPTRILLMTPKGISIVWEA